MPPQPSVALPGGIEADEAPFEPLQRLQVLCDAPGLGTGAHDEHARHPEESRDEGDPQPHGHQAHEEVQHRADDEVGGRLPVQIRGEHDIGDVCADHEGQNRAPHDAAETHFHRRLPIKANEGVQQQHGSRETQGVHPGSLVQTDGHRGRVGPAAGQGRKHEHRREIAQQAVGQQLEQRRQRDVVLKQAEHPHDPSVHSHPPV